MKLDREVALKVLPNVLISEPDRVARFEREAKLLASLNHPQIAAIYGFEEANGKRVLVLELVEGPTLADRIDAWPLSLGGRSNARLDGASVLCYRSLILILRNFMTNGPWSFIPWT